MPTYYLKQVAPIDLKCCQTGRIYPLRRRTHVEAAQPAAIRRSMEQDHKGHHKAQAGKKAERKKERTQSRDGKRCARRLPGHAAPLRSINASMTMLVVGGG